jgi:hypothetical protein
MVGLPGTRRPAAALWFGGVLLPAAAAALAAAACFGLETGLAHRAWPQIPMLAAILGVPLVAAVLLSVGPERAGAHVEALRRAALVAESVALYFAGSALTTGIVGLFAVGFSPWRPSSVALLLLVIGVAAAPLTAVHTLRTLRSDLDRAEPLVRRTPRTVLRWRLATWALLATLGQASALCIDEPDARGDHQAAACFFLIGACIFFPVFHHFEVKPKRRKTAAPKRLFGGR